MNPRSKRNIFWILLVGFLFGIFIFKGDWFSFKKKTSTSVHLPTQSTLSEYKKGSHGGILLTKEDLQLEVLLIEDKNNPPHFRVYPFNSEGNAINLSQLQLQIQLNRLDQTNKFLFRPSGEYFENNEIVEEPHSFEVEVTAKFNNKDYSWNYSHYESRAEISSESARNAGIELSKAGPANLKKVMQLPGEIGLHEKRVAHVVPRVDAMVLKVNKDLGDKVRKGDLLAILESRELADARSAYLAAIKKAEPVRMDLERQQMLYKNTKTMIDLLNEEKDLDQIHDEIDKLILGESRAQLIPAYAKLLRSQAVYEREKLLYEKKISSRSEYLLAFEEFKSSDAKYKAMREEVEYKNQILMLEKKRNFDMANLQIQTTQQKLLALGLSKKEIQKLPDSKGQKFTQYELRSAIDGEVIQKHITAGEAVKKDDDIFVLANLSEVWVNIAVPAKDLNIIKLGQSIKVKSDNLGIEATGKLTYLGSIIDEKTRTVTGRVVISNTDQQWRPGMYVTIELLKESREVSLAVQASAIQSYQGWSVVFIKVGDIYEARPLELGESDGQWIEVLKGLQPGAEYVSKNSFVIKAEIGKSGASQDH